MPRLVARLGALLLLAGLLPACATVTTGSNQGISVITEPAGASCTLQREGAVVAVVNPTPGTVQVSKSVRDIAVRCTRPGHSPGVTALPAQFQAMTAGNIILGGLIGLAVDAASGALGRYPETITVSLPPESFPTEQGREQYFLSRAVDTRRAYDERIATARGECAPNNRMSCEARIRDLETERDAELMRLEQLSRSARIGQGA